MLTPKNPNNQFPRKHEIPMAKKIVDAKFGAEDWIISRRKLGFAFLHKCAVIHPKHLTKTLLSV
jgi:hypothetical protein